MEQIRVSTPCLANQETACALGTALLSGCNQRDSPGQPQARSGPAAAGCSPWQGGWEQGSCWARPAPRGGCSAESLAPVFTKGTWTTPRGAVLVPCAAGTYALAPSLRGYFSGLEVPSVLLNAMALEQAWGSGPRNSARLPCLLGWVACCCRSFALARPPRRTRAYSGSRCVMVAAICLVGINAIFTGGCCAQAVLPDWSMLA
ncbi:RNA-binding protein with multiple splicing isoform X8 [Halichoerus grypus]